jgi:hypothetical protein
MSDKRLDNLIPFSGADDPRRSNGRPKGIPNTKTRLQRILNLIEKHKNPVTGEMEDFTVAELLDLQQIIKARKGDTKAYSLLMDRLEGKPSQAVDITTDGQSLNVIVDGAYARQPKFRIDNNTSATYDMAEDSSQ